LEPPATNGALSGNLLLIDREIRELIERDIVISLAGIVAVELWRPVDGYRLEAATTDEVERVTRGLEDAGYVERVELFEATPPLERTSDEDHVFRVAALWSGDPQAAGAFAHRLLAETVALVRSRAFARPLAALVEQLLRHASLPGNEVHRIVSEHSDPWRENRMARTKTKHVAREPFGAGLARGARPTDEGDSFRRPAS
jgi:hypothetical protein